MFWLFYVTGVIACFVWSLACTLAIVDWVVALYLARRRGDKIDQSLLTVWFRTHVLSSVLPISLCALAGIVLVPFELLALFMLMSYAWQTRLSIKINRILPPDVWDQMAPAPWDVPEVEGDSTLERSI